MHIKKNKIIILLFIIFLFPRFIYSLDSFSSDLKYFKSIYPIKEGSPSEQKAVARIKSRLNYLGLNYTEESLDHFENFHSFSKYLEIDIKGQKTDTIIIAVSLNSIIEDEKEIDNSVNLALVLDVIKNLLKTKNTFTYKILILGAEYGNGSEYPLGSNSFLDSYYPDDPPVVFYLNFKNIPERITIKPGTSGLVSPYWFINSAKSSFDENKLFYLLRGNETQIFRLALDEKELQINSYLKQGYPSLFLESGKNEASDYKQWLKDFNAFFTSFENRNKTGFDKEWDRHYLFFQVKKFKVIISEKIYIVLLILLFSLIALYTLFYTKGVVKYAESIKMHFLMLPVLFFIIFGVLLFSSIFIKIFLLLKGFPALWKYYPGIFISLKLLIAIFLFFIVFRYIKRMPFSRKGSFYTASAIFFILIDIFILAIFNISFTYYPVWLLICAFLFSLLKDKKHRVLVLLLAPVWLMKWLIDIVSIPYLKACRFLILSIIPGDLLIAFIILPIILMVIRLDFMFRKTNREKILISFLLIGFGIIIIVLMNFLVTADPYIAPDKKQRVTVVKTINQDNNSSRIKIDSEAPFGKLKIQDKNKVFFIDSEKRSHFYSRADKRKIIKLRTSDRRFLGRKNVSLAINTEGRPQAIYISINSKNKMPLYDVNFPYVLSSKDNRVDLLIGANPPENLLVNFTVPDKFSFDVNVKAEYNKFPDNVKVSSMNKEIFRKMLVNTRIIFEE